MMFRITWVQEYQKRDTGVLPRRAFSRAAKQALCPLSFPWPNDQVVVLRTGMLQHIKRYMQVRSRHLAQLLRVGFFL
jgi:hypothetical protein